MTTGSMWLLLCALGAFLAGSIPFGWIFARMKGIDLTKIGSGNIGATNAARALGRPVGVLVLILDGGKAFLPVWLAQRYGGGLPDYGVPGAVPALIGFVAILGHVFSPWMAWKGGKGVASSLGVFLALDPFAAAVASGLWLLLYLAFRIASIGSLVAAVALVVTMMVRKGPTGYLIAVGATFVVVVARHADNIRRLLAKEETRV